MHVLVAASNRMDARFELLQNTLQTHAAGRTEGAVVAKIAAASSHRAIDVGTGETGIDADPLDPAPVAASQCRPKRVEQQTFTLPGESIVNSSARLHGDSCQTGDGSQNSTVDRL